MVLLYLYTSSINVNDKNLGIDHIDRICKIILLLDLNINDSLNSFQNYDRIKSVLRNIKPNTCQKMREIQLPKFATSIVIYLITKLQLILIQLILVQCQFILNSIVLCNVNSKKLKDKSKQYQTKITLSVTVHDSHSNRTRFE